MTSDSCPHDGSCPSCGHGRFVVVPAAYVYLTRMTNGQREVLLQRRGDSVSYLPGHWAAGAAGHVERGESAYHSARRETREELGVTPTTQGPGQADGLEFLTTVHRSAGGAPLDERVDFFFACHEWAGTPSIQEPAKCAELRWVRLAEPWPEPIVPQEREVLTRWARGELTPYLSLGFS